MSYKVVKYVEASKGRSREEVATFDNAVRAEEYARTLTNMEPPKPGWKTWFKIEDTSQVPIGEAIGQAMEVKETQVQVYKLTAGPLSKGLMVVNRDLKPFFADKSGKISVELDGMGEKQLSHNFEDARIYGLSTWYKQQGARSGDYLSIRLLEPFKKYSFSIVRAPLGRELPRPHGVGVEVHRTPTLGIPLAPITTSGIVLRGKLFLPHRFAGQNGEAELERHFIENYRQALGEGTLFLPKKKLVGSEVKKVTDGLLLDVNDPSRPSFWIVELELSTHDLEDHIQKQLFGFLTALEEDRTIRSLVKAVHDYIEDVEESKLAWTKFFDHACKHSGVQSFQFLDSLLRRECGLLVVIDEETPQLRTFVGLLSKLRPVKVVEFKTFKGDGEFVHSFSHTALGRKVPLEAEAEAVRRPKAKGERLVRKRGNETLEQILGVVAAMKSGVLYSEACRMVATKKSITVQSVRDKTTRRLGLSKTEFEYRFLSRTLEELLMQRFPNAKKEIESFFAGGQFILL